MEQKDIIFGKGIHRAPSVAVEDGELSECVNLMPKNGELVNAKVPEEIGVTLPQDAKLLAIHNVSNDTHYIFKTKYRNVDVPGGSETGPDGSEESTYVIGYDTKIEDNKLVLYGKCDYEIPCDITIVYTFVGQNGSVTNGTTLSEGWKNGKIGECSDVTKTLDWVKCTNAECKVILVRMTGADFSGSTSPSKSKRHKVVSTKDSLVYISKNDEEQEIISLGVEQDLKINSINIVGNILCLVTDEGLRYVQWREKADEYVYLGATPDIRIDFKLSGDMKYIGFKDAITISHGTAIKKAYDNLWYHYDISSVSSLTITGEMLSSKFPYGGRCHVYAVHANVALKVVYYSGKTEEISQRYENGLWFNFDEDFSHILVYQISTGGSLISGVYVTCDESNMSEENFDQYTYLANNEGSGGIKEEDNFIALSGKVKYFIDHYSYQKYSYFIFPFFVRYGIKLTDGSIIHQSEPMLMVPNSGFTPSVLVAGKSDEIYYDFSTDVFIGANCCNLMFKATVDDDYTPWKDMISEVVIAISAPIYVYNESEEYNKDFVQVRFNEITDTDDIPGAYGIINGQKVRINAGKLYRDAADQIGSRSTIAPKLYVAKLPFFSTEKIKENYLSSSVFYKIASYKIDELDKYSSWNILRIMDASLRNLQTLPTMTDDYNSRNVMVPQGAFVYNNRLNIYNISEQIAVPKHPTSPLYNYTHENYKYVIYYRNENGEHITSTEWSCDTPNMRWFYIGSTSAYKCVIYRRYGSESSQYTYKKAEVLLNIHPWLNGAYNLDLSDSFDWNEQEDCDSEEAEAEYSNGELFQNNPNAIYASNTFNPFYFPVTLQNKIGTARINAVSTTAKALSQGQFGQFPMYAFTNDGIWSLSVNEQGQYATSNPVNRDVVTNTDSICQIDDAVVYTCSQGLKLLSGSDTQILSAQMEGKNISEEEFLGNMDTNHSGLVVEDSSSVINMLERCKIMFDSSGGRLLHVYPESCVDKGMHYVYSFDSNEWSVIVGDESKIKSIIPGYPYSTFHTADNKLKQYTNNEDNDTVRYGFILTRAMAFGNPFVMKMLDDLRMIYTKNNSEHLASCKIGVFVSNDRVKWSQLKSLRKHSYKWYRFRIQTAMTDMDALTALTCRIEEKQSNKIR